MANPEINVGVNTQAAQQDLQQLASDINKFLQTQAQAAGKMPRLLDLSADIEALKELKKQFQEVINSQPSIRGPLNNAGQGNANRPIVPSQINLGGIASTPQEQAKFLERVMTRLLTHHLSQSANPINTGLTFQELTGRAAPVPGPAPTTSGIARHLVGQAVSGGAGGSLGAAAGATLQGAASGLAGLGVVGGGLLGLAGFGVFKAASTMNEGLDKAKSEAIEIDKFKRQLGDVGVDFDLLRDHVREAAAGMGLSFEQAGKMAQILSRESHSKIRDEQAIGAETKNAAAVARATGIDGDAIARFFAEMRAVRATDNVQDSRKMSLMIADAIKRSGDPLNADKMLQSMASFAERTRDQSLGRVNVGAYGGMLAGMMGGGIAAGTATNILNSFDQSTRNGGGSEAAEAFLFQALGGNKIGAGNAMKLRQAGMFASTNSVFGSDKSPFYNPNYRSGTDTMNVTRYMQEMERQFPGRDQQSRDVKLDSLASFFGGNYAHAQTFMNAYQKHGAAGLDTTSKMLSNYGISPDGINMTGMVQLAGIANAKGLDGLQEQRGLLEKRTDLKDDQKALLTKLVKETDTDVLRKSLADIAKTLDSEQTDGKALKDAAVSMDQNIQSLATKLIPESLFTNELLGGLVEKLAPDSDIATRLRLDAQDAEMGSASTPQQVSKKNSTLKARSELLMPGMFENDRMFGLPKGTTAAFAQSESNFRPDRRKGIGRDADGKIYETKATGMFQLLPAAIADATPEFVARFKRQPNMEDAYDQNKMFGIYYGQLLKRTNGNVAAADRMYFAGGTYVDGKVIKGSDKVSEAQKDAKVNELISLRGQFAEIPDMPHLATPKGNPQQEAERRALNANISLTGNPRVDIRLIDQQMQERGSASVPLPLGAGKATASGSQRTGSW